MNEETKKDVWAWADIEKITNSAGFRSALAIIQITFVFAFSIIGALFFPGAKDPATIVWRDFIIYLLMYLFVQISSYQISFDWFLDMLRRFHPKVKAERKIYNGLTETLEKHPEKVDRALLEWNINEKIALVQKRIKKRIAHWESKISKERYRKRPRKQRLDYFESCKANLIEVLTSKEFIKDIEYRAVKGFRATTYQELMNSELTDVDSEENSLRSLGTYKAKKLATKMVVFVVTSVFGAFVIWQTLQRDGALGRVSYMLFLMFSNIGFGVGMAFDAMANIILYNFTLKNRICRFCAEKEQIPIT